MRMNSPKQKPKISKALYQKGIMLGSAVVLLLATVVYLTTAWYTKMVSVSGMQFTAAQWDFTANHAEDTLTINVFEYASLNKDRAAPGTAGEIPLVLGALQSDTDVQYTVTVDRSSMSEEFRNRIFFFYLEDPTVSYKVESNRIYFGGSPTDPTATNTVYMPGTIPKNDEVTTRIYWEWIYEAPAGTSDADAKLWDEFDTKVGEKPDLYVGDMNATVTIAGAQVNHEG